MSSYEKITLITFDSKNKTFDYSFAKNGDFFNVCFNNRPIWQIFLEDNIADKKIASNFQKQIENLSSLDSPATIADLVTLHNSFDISAKYNVIYTYTPNSNISISIFPYKKTDYTFLNDKNQVLTNLVDYYTFCTNIDLILSENREKAKNGEYAIVYFDILHFKAINDMFGSAEGNKLLEYIADTIVSLIEDTGFGHHVGSDRFVFFTETSGDKLISLLETLIKKLTSYNLVIKVACNAGIYVTNEELLPAGAMIDRAILAHSSIKGNYTIKYNFFTESLRKIMLTEQEITGTMSDALSDKQFLVYYQPQYNHSTGMLVGAEALIRWKHPEKGLISPAVFIPIFEKNGFITTIDLYVFEQTCIFIRQCLDKGINVVPISSNFSRHDIYLPNFVKKLEEIRTKYHIPVQYIRIEITESAIVGGSEYLNQIVKQLHKCGYIVEMDDFGSGYSSLNVLKDIDLDILKLDLKFLSDENASNRSGTILTSIVRMAKWLSMPVIAEGVETVKQADFLQSIGCDYIQGYLYSKPIQEEDFFKLLSSTSIEKVVPQMRLIETLNACNFWDPQSQETLIFSNYVGGAAIFDYHNGQPEILRVNKKYIEELRMNLTEKDVIESDLFSSINEIDKNKYIKMLNEAIKTGEEQECETWRTVKSQCCGEDKICIRCNVRMIGKSKDSYLFYAMIRNVTKEKNQMSDILNIEKRFKMASEQANIYFWEYTIATKEMRPCFRCMRDLGLPPIVHNYPEPAIEAGIFPQDYADMYRDWHVQLSKGVKQLEAVIPLTVGRVPFIVRYTTEFDISGKPVKAYGSATLVVDNNSRS